VAPEGHGARTVTRRYRFVMVGRNCAPWAARAVASVVAASAGHDVAIVAVDDASTDGTADIVRTALDTSGLTSACVTRREPLGAMRNQWDAWHALALMGGIEPSDVIVWVDLDDRLDDVPVLDVLDRYYDAGAVMTYGSYRSEPLSPTCAPARPYPPQAIRTGRFRDLTVAGGLCYNHLRTVSWEILSQLTEADCQDDDGRWWTSGPDAAVMLPSLELAGARAAFVKECLYVYNSANPASEWRDHPARVRANHKAMLARTPKRPAGAARPLSRGDRVRARRRGARR
jgi:hypothetical protein